MKEAVKGCITMTSQLSLKVARPKCVTLIQDGWDTGFKPVISKCRSDTLLLKLMNEQDTVSCVKDYSLLLCFS
jgi:hypothetical protein